MHLQRTSESLYGLGYLMLSPLFSSEEKSYFITHLGIMAQKTFGCAEWFQGTPHSYLLAKKYFFAN